MSAGGESQSRRAPYSRAGLLGGMMLGTAAAILGLKISGAINQSTAYILAIIPVALMFAFFRHAHGAAKTGKGASTAAARYTRGIMASSLAYMLGLGIALWVWRNLDPSIGLTWVLAMLPIIPIFWMIYVMGRYIAEEADEYLRHRAIMASLVGLGAVLAIGSFWGFLETFELVPHVPGWWAVPIWAFGMGIAQGVQALRDRNGAGA
ncbi:hypothetical protein [Pseudoblastomonas halimionae]|uniref:Uncharacterized protein n=1 Tax=Alteriqipengyuania halimionae TaxID=1926630 RepID=A0A6I4U4K8_9SPHN|nr:hypothetical protein [Alteriqipengyuania halimionae]MXP10666.1 hypothetical protein [Alteriqipengyuania halimionae]